MTRPDQTGRHLYRAERTPATPSTQVPRHLAVVLDGNRRWAACHNLSLAAAYRAGARRVHDLMTWCEEAGIPVITVWALSQGNLNRDGEQVAGIAQAVTEGVLGMAAERRWRIRPIGALDRLPHDHAAVLREVEADTRHHSGAELNVAVAYSGRQDILNAINTLLHHRRTPTGPGVPACALTEEDLARYLSTAGQPDIDLLIRTSGEQRLSGFMAWQVDQAELYFTDTLWPDFDRDSFDAALRWYSTRHRRRGL
ncbi:di-trans,poly-cis-decaprenylcistransferase [Streptomyces spinoverrucosus]|uniref:polyprenyl diphosphate synthase n=1 Tax=Streptomyces spinoverrucosus TaxID=284043 RepID=UPI0018C36C5C|nr:polyprenyl diphosphate synthase [Streptomyces spinoverrucosus]MBG0851346.1 di-trans,poly-cis-decaprenylcistransferase [Streptomyces spinoverrucosus]